MNRDLIRYFHYLNVSAVIAGVYLILVYFVIGQIDKGIQQAAFTAVHLAVTVWFRNRYNLKP